MTLPTKARAAQALVEPPPARDRTMCGVFGDGTMEVVAMTAGDELHRLRGVFTEVPGTYVTCDQAARLAGIHPDRCAALLNALVDVGFLQLSGGRYRRAE